VKIRTLFKYNSYRTKSHGPTKSLVLAHNFHISLFASHVVLSMFSKFLPIWLLQCYHKNSAIAQSTKCWYKYSTQIQSTAQLLSLSAYSDQSTYHHCNFIPSQRFALSPTNPFKWRTSGDGLRSFEPRKFALIPPFLFFVPFVFTNVINYILLYCFVCTVWYARTNVMSSRISFVVASVLSSKHWNICI